MIQLAGHRCHPPSLYECACRCMDEHCGKDVENVNEVVVNDDGEDADGGEELEEDGRGGC